MTNVDPPDAIPSHRVTEFRGRYGDCVEKEISEFEANEEANYRDALKQNIREDKRHRELLNLSTFPFVEFQPLEYEFLRADPLEELGVPNFDFLLFDFDGHAIFGEVKGNVGEGYASNYVDQVINQKEAVEENEQYIVDNYTGQPIRHKEFVLAVFAPDANDITQQIISERANIVTWGLHQMDKKISVNTALPTPEDWSDDPNEIYPLLRHEHTDLNSELPRYSSSTECFDLFPKSHPVTQMRSLITARHKEGGQCFVMEEDLWSTIQESLFYLSNDREQETMDDVIETATSIQFLREAESEEKDYKIVSRYTHSDGLEKTLERKWIANKVEERKDQIKQNCRETIRDEILSETQAQRTIWDFL